VNDSDPVKSAHDGRHPVIEWRERLLSDGRIYPAHDLPSSARFVGVALSMYAGTDMRSWPSATSVGIRCGLVDRSVRRAFADLEAAGWLTAEVRGGVAGGRRTTVWKLLTPDIVSEVTPDKSAEVNPSTSDILSTTPDKSAPTPDTESDELEELGTELEREPLARVIVLHHPEETDAAIAGAVGRWGSARVHELVNAYAVAGTQFTYASELRRRIDLDAPQRPIAAVRERCNECNGAGYVLPIGSDIAVRCACTKAVSA